MPSAACYDTSACPFHPTGAGWLACFVWAIELSVTHSLSRWTRPKTPTPHSFEVEFGPNLRPACSSLLALRPPSPPFAPLPLAPSPSTVTRYTVQYLLLPRPPPLASTTDSSPPPHSSDGQDVEYRPRYTQISTVSGCGVCVCVCGVPYGMLQRPHVTTASDR